MALDVWWSILWGALGVNVAARMLGGLRSTTIERAERGSVPRASITVIVPVLDEAERIGPCLRGLREAGPEVGEILIVDGGSRDGTIARVRELCAGDARIRIVDAAPIPDGWNGKAWGLESGLRAGSPDATWIVTIDADVRPTANLFAAMVRHAQSRNVAALSVATRQELAGPIVAILHPAMLATLIYRFGLPGREASRVSDVQANGQCFLATRTLLFEHDAFASARSSRCEDVTVARSLVAAGVVVGFYEAPELVSVRMHESWHDAWSNWPRSLTLRDRYARFGGWLGLAEVIAVQALPLPLVAVLALLHATDSPMFAVAAALTIMRIGVLAGSRRAYVRPPATYWLAPLADLPVAFALIIAMLKRSHTWRGRNLVLAERNG